MIREHERYVNIGLEQHLRESGHDSEKVVKKMVKKTKNTNKKTKKSCSNLMTDYCPSSFITQQKIPV
jgi:hypothetical protein